MKTDPEIQKIFPVILLLKKLRHESFAGPPQILQLLLFENASKNK